MNTYIWQRPMPTAEGPGQWPNVTWYWSPACVIVRAANLTEARKELLKLLPSEATDYLKSYAKRVKPDRELKGDQPAAVLVKKSHR